MLVLVDLLETKVTQDTQVMVVMVDLVVMVEVDNHLVVEEAAVGLLLSQVVMEQVVVHMVEQEVVEEAVLVAAAAVDQVDLAVEEVML